MIKRDTFLNQIIERKNNGMIKTITGMRRCGKSFLLFELYKKYLLKNNVRPSNIIEVNFDSIASSDLRNPFTFFSYIESKIKKSGKYYLLLDEIQLLDRFEEVLNGILKYKNVDIYVTGSNAKFLAKDIITEFRGRSDNIRLTPLTFNELYSVKKNNETAYNEYILYGGLPQAVLAKDKIAKRKYLNDIFMNTYIKDVVERNKIKYKNELIDILKVIASNVGTLSSVTNISNTFASNAHTILNRKSIKKYLDYMCDAYVISEAEQYDIKGRKYIGANSKYYFNDLGIRNAILNFRQIDEGHLFENLIYNELVAKGYAVDIGTLKERKKDNNGSFIRQSNEIDFVCNNETQKFYIQVLLDINNEKTFEREMRPLLKLNTGYKKIIIAKNVLETYYDANGILIMNVFDFLKSNKL